MTSGPNEQHTDAVRPFPAKTDREYETQQTYEDPPAKDGYGNVAERFVDSIELQHPASTVADLHDTGHLQAQFHEENAEQWDDASLPNDGGVLYDLAILSVADDALAAEDLTLDEDGTSAATRVIETGPARRVKAVFLYRARCTPTVTAFHTRLASADPVLDALGYRDGFVSYDVFRNAANQAVPEALAAIEDGQEAFANAVTRAVYAVFRNGIVPPAAVRTAYGFDAVAPPVRPTAVPRDTEQAALRNWIRLLVDETLAPLTFGRDSSERKHDLLQFIGALAASARSGAGLQEVPNELDYVYPRKRIPDGSGFARYVRKLARDPSTLQAAEAESPSITAQFEQAHRATLAMAARRGFFDEPRTVAIDLFRIDWTGEPNDVTINRPARGEDDVRSQWTYAVLGIIEPDARFTLGVRWLDSKDKYPQAVGHLAEFVDGVVPVSAVYADAEIVSGALIEQLRGLAGAEWVVKAPEQPLIKQLKRATPATYAGVVPDVTWGTDPKPTLVTYPAPHVGTGTINGVVEFTERQLQEIDVEAGTDGNATLPEYDVVEPHQASAEGWSLPAEVSEFASRPQVGNVTSHNAYFTDQDPAALSPAKTHFDYYNRWAIEASINDIKGYYLPQIASGNEKLRLYGVHTAVLLQNWHTLINRALSPEYHLQLDVTNTELLSGIIDVAFGDTIS